MQPSLKKFMDNVKSEMVFKGEFISADGVRVIAVTYPIRIAGHTLSIMISTPGKVFAKLLTPFSQKYALVGVVVFIAVVGTSFIIILMIERWNIQLDSTVKIRTQELSLSEQKLRGMVETINELIWEIDADGKYVYVSPTANRILGYQPEELLGRTVFDLMPEGDAQKLMSTLQSIGESKLPFNNLERVNIHKSGEHIILETNGAPILDTKGVLTGFRGADRDITERKQADKELQKYAVKLEEARNNLELKVEQRTFELKKAHDMLVRKEKLAALGELSSSVSHELRNPLGVIKNAVYFCNMKMDTFEDEAIKENIEIIAREINIADKIISDLLDFTRCKTPVRLAIDINQLVREMLSKSLIPQNVSVVTDFSNAMTLISVDPTQVAHIFLNLIENGVQSMEEGGTLIVSTTFTDSIVKVIFADEGCGIPQSNLKMIFEPLFTTKAKGIGLGLPVSKNMAEANGGSITVESKEGKGSTFTVRFQV